MQEGTTQTVSLSSTTTSDVLTEILRQGAQRMLATAIESEAADWIERHGHVLDEKGRRQVVRNGYLPERKITTGLGEIEVQQPRVHDRRVPEERKQYVYVWADGIHFNIRLEEDRQCILVLMGATEEGKKELIAIHDGHRESAQSWKELLLDCKARGLVVDPHLATGDGALGFWKALAETYPKTREQRCTVHKTANVLDKLPKRLQPAAKEKLHDIWQADTREHANEAFDLFVATYSAKYPKAVECLSKDRDALLAFYDFPAEHSIHLRTTNPIESTFATVRHRHRRTKGNGSRKACLAMVFKLTQAAEKKWRLLNGSKIMPDVIRGVRFIDGVREAQAAA